MDNNLGKRLFCQLLFNIDDGIFNISFDLLGFPDDLVDHAFGLKFVVIGQFPDFHLNPAFDLVELAFGFIVERVDLFLRIVMIRFQIMRQFVTGIQNLLGGVDYFIL
jgi:hypothetical protein